MTLWLPVTLLLSSIGAAVVAALPARGVAQDRCRITYVANAGVLFESGAARFLIDAPIREGISPYAVPDPAARAALEGARAPFDAITAILITHWHEDHFSAAAVAAHLSADPRSVLIASNEIVERVRQADPSLPTARFRPSTPEPGTAAKVEVAGVPVHVLRIRHNQTRRRPEQHTGFLVEGCRTVLHTGDADPSAQNFTVLDRLPRVEVGLLPFWYVLEIPARAFVANAIRPHRTLALHIPPGDASKVEARLRETQTVTALTRPGQMVDLSR